MPSWQDRLKRLSMITLVDIFPLFLLFLIMYKAHPVKPLDAINEEYLSLETTKYYRGFFALVIVFHHLSQKTISGLIFPYFSYAGYLAVSLFFFFSGYGLQKSYITKAESYRKGFLINRIPGVLLPYLVFVGIYWITSAIGGNVYTVPDIMRSIINGKPFVTYSWFIIHIIVFYFFYWIFMTTCGKHYQRIILLGCVWYILWVFFCILLDYNIWWYNSSHLLIIGMVWATYEKRIRSFFRCYYFVVAPIVWFAFFVLFILQDRINMLFHMRFASTLLLSLMLTVLFTISVILLSMKIKIGNRVLGFLGVISLEIYLSHGLLIKNVSIPNDFVRCVIAVTLSVLLAYISHKMISVVLKGYKSLVKKRQ